MADGVQNCQNRLNRQNQAIVKLTELAHLLEECATRFVERASVANRVARRAEKRSEVAAISMAMLILMIIVLVCLGY